MKKATFIGLLILTLLMSSWPLTFIAFAADVVVPDFSTVTASPYPLVAYSGNPVLTASMVTDRQANFVADPFLFKNGNIWYCFFEVESDQPSRQYGSAEEIGVANSSDGLHWNYMQIVLTDPNFRFSFPQVYADNGNFYMVPDSYGGNSERLYEATNFPISWTYVSTLVSGNPYGLFADPSLFYYNGLWWMFVADTTNSNCYLYYSQSLTGGWTQHPDSPIVTNNLGMARPAGRTILYNGNVILRFVQNCSVTYGQGVRAFQVDTLTTTSFSEHEIPASPLLFASGSGWNAEAMHTFGCWWNGTSWIVSVDGAGTTSYGSPWSIGIYTTTAKARALSVSISPGSATLDVGQSKQFTSTVSGGTSPYTYQWYLNGNAVLGARNPTWTFKPTSAGSYRVYLKVNDKVGMQATSNTANVTVNAVPSVTISPTSTTLSVGQSKQFTSTVSGGTSPYTYQWYLNGNAVLGATNPTWTFKPTSAGSYRVYLKVKDKVGIQATSNTAQVRALRTKP